MNIDPAHPTPPNEPAVTPSDRPGSQQFSMKTLMAADRLRREADHVAGSQQFSLKTLMAVVAGTAVLFGVLTWLGLRGIGALVAFAAAGGGAVAAIIVIELCWAVRNWMRPSHAPSQWTQTSIHRPEPPRVSGLEPPSSG